MTLWKPFGLVTAIGFLASVGVLANANFPFSLKPGSPGWTRLVRGADPQGNVNHKAVVRLPGINRRSPPHVFIDIEPEPDSRAMLSVSVDRGPVYRLSSDRDGRVSLALPRAQQPGARLDILRVDEMPPIRVRSLVVKPTTGPAWGSALLAFGLTGGLTLAFLVWRGSGVAGGLGLCTAGLLTLAYSSSMVFLLFPDRSSLLRLLLIAGPALGCVVSGQRLERSIRPFHWLAVSVLFATVFGLWIRLFFLPSAGSWDVEFWQAWTDRATSHGVARVYGDPDTVPPGHFLPQLRGEKPLWELQSRGRSFLIDYPPLAMAAWRASWALTRRLPLPLDQAEARNVAAKLPAVAGDIAIILMLLWLFRARPRRAVVLASLYWTLPVSWLSSAVLGFQDETYAPLAMGAVIAASRSRALPAGALLVGAAMTKLLGAIATPSVAVALLASRARLWMAIAAAVGAVAIVLLPFAFAATVPAMAVQLLRQLVPGNLSSGYANPWWIYGHLVNLSSGLTESIAGPTSRLLLRDVPFAAARVGTGLFAFAVGWICWRHYRFTGVFPAALACAVVFLAYATFSVGVFENHPHIAFPLLFATGLWSRRTQIVCAVAMTSYVLNLLLLSGLGRFYGTRYMILEPVVNALSDLRMAPGFDLTLLLAIVNTVVMIWFLVTLPRELETLEQWEKTQLR